MHDEAQELAGDAKAKFSDASDKVKMAANDAKREVQGAGHGKY